MRRLGALAALVVVCLLGATLAQASTVTVTIPDPSPDPYIYFGTGDATVTYSGVTFTQQLSLGDANLFNVGVLFSGLPAVLSSQQASFGLDNILITLPNFTSSFGVNYGTFNGSDVTFLASNGDTATFASTGTGDYQTPDGVTYNGSPINWVLITSPDFVLNINNISYDTSAVPEPGTMVMLGSGLLVLGGAVRRKLML